MMRRLSVLLGLLALCGLGTVAPAREAAASGTLVSVSGVGDTSEDCPNGCYEGAKWDVTLSHWHIGDAGLGLGLVNATVNRRWYKGRADETCLVPIAFDIRLVSTAPRSVAFKCVGVYTISTWQSGAWVPAYFGLPMLEVLDFTLTEGTAGSPGYLGRPPHFYKVGATLRPVAIATT